MKVNKDDYKNPDGTFNGIKSGTESHCVLCLDGEEFDPANCGCCECVVRNAE